MRTDPRLHAYYEEGFSEAERLERREGRLEFERTKALLARYLPASPAQIIDVGGGTGAYADWLASLGHTVHLVDLVQAHVDAASVKGTFTAAVGDARALTCADDSYDFGLLRGPLYHLREAADRLSALKEAGRVVRSGGLIAVAYISRLAVPLDGYVKGWVYGGRGLAALQNVVREGRDAGGGFGSVAYFHLPSDIEPELRAAGLELTALFGVEGPGWTSPDFDERWAQPEGRRLLLETAEACEASPELLGLSAHLLAFARQV